ncbi:MAG: endolytic transglycosylase MltG [Pseudomonadota bacterium]
MRWLLRLLLLAVLAAGSAAGAAWWWLQQPLALATPTVEVSIEPGLTPRRVAEMWVEAGVQVSPRWLYEWFRWSGRSRQIRAGSYEIETGVTPQALLDKMVRGDEVLESVRLAEGSTFSQMREALARAPSLKPASRGLSDAQLMAAVGEPTLAPEGRFFPDTYAYSRGVSDLTVLKRAHAAMQRRLVSTWAERAADLPLKSMDEALILASIVEKETGRDGDRALVAAVFANRLRIGMPLQTDPTVIYGLGAAFDGNLRKRDLLADTPYNTYTRPGLPPTPIALPSAASLRAAVQPAKTKALYFVARSDGGGGSVFSETLADHNRAVNQFQRGGKAPP